MYVDEMRVWLAENQPQNQVQERLQKYIYMKLMLKSMDFKIENLFLIPLLKAIGGSRLF